MRTKKVTGTAVSIPKGLAVGAMLQIIITAAGTAILCGLIESGTITDTMIGYLCMGVLAIGSAAGAFLTAAKIKRRRLLVCYLSATVYFLILLGTNIAFLGANLQGIPASGVIILIGATIAAISGLGLKKQGTKKYKNYHLC